jgi:hypothetical protein
VPEACALLSAYLKKFQLSQTYNTEEFAHWFLPRDGVIHSFVVEVLPRPAPRPAPLFCMQLCSCTLHFA